MTSIVSNIVESFSVTGIRPADFAIFASVSDLISSANLIRTSEKRANLSEGPGYSKMYLAIASFSMHQLVTALSKAVQHGLSLPLFLDRQPRTASPIYSHASDLKVFISSLAMVAVPSPYM